MIRIAAQPLAAALEAVARQSGVDILFAPDSVRGRNAVPLAARLSARAAVERLIAGQPLQVRQETSGALTVTATQSVPPVGAASQTTDADLPGMAGNADEDIVVTGYAGSLTGALDEKRRATNVVDVVRADDIGKFPAQNIAEALQRVPGVSIVRDRGEGVFVRIRGLGANFQVVTLNNRTVAVNENVRDSGQSGRQFRFDTLPSELMSAVEVVKSPRADLDEGGHRRDRQPAHVSARRPQGLVAEPVGQCERTLAGGQGQPPPVGAGELDERGGDDRRAGRRRV